MDLLTHSVDSETFSSNHRFIDTNLLYFKRQHSRKNARVETDVFSSLAGIGIGHFKPGEVSVFRKNKLAFCGLFAFYIPPFSIIEWHLGASELEWDGYLFIPPPSISPLKDAMAFRLNSAPSINNFDDIVRFVAQQDGKDGQLIGKFAESSKLAGQTKALIDQSYLDLEKGSISEISQSIGHSNSFISQKFKKAYGISPIAYRNKLRVFEAIRLMMFERKNVTTSGFESGFSDLGRFNKQFSKTFRTSPSKYRLPRKK